MYVFIQEYNICPFLGPRNRISCQKDCLSHYTPQLEKDLKNKNVFFFFFLFFKLLNEWFWSGVHHNSNFQTVGRLFGFNSFIYSAWIWCAPNNNNASTPYSFISKNHIRLDAYMTKNPISLLTRYKDSNLLWFPLNQCHFTVYVIYVDTTSLKSK